jgi:hypothetical protein
LQNLELRVVPMSVDPVVRLELLQNIDFK